MGTVRAFPSQMPSRPLGNNKAASLLLVSFAKVSNSNDLLNRQTLLLLRLILLILLLRLLETLLRLLLLLLKYISSSAGMVLSRRQKVPGYPGCRLSVFGRLRVGTEVGLGSTHRLKVLDSGCYIDLCAVCQYIAVTDSATATAPATVASTVTVAASHKRSPLPIPIPIRLSPPIPPPVPPPLPLPLPPPPPLP